MILAFGTLHAPGWNEGESPSVQVAQWGYGGCAGWYAPSMGGWEPTHWMPLPPPPNPPQDPAHLAASSTGAQRTTHD